MIGLLLDSNPDSTVFSAGKSQGPKKAESDGAGSVSQKQITFDFQNSFRHPGVKLPDVTALTNLFHLAAALLAFLWVSRSTRLAMIKTSDITIYSLGGSTGSDLLLSYFERFEQVDPVLAGRLCKRVKGSCQTSLVLVFPFLA